MPRPAAVESTGRDLPPRTLAGRRRDQLTKAPDYGAVLVPPAARPMAQNEERGVDAPAVKREAEEGWEKGR